MKKGREIIGLPVIALATSAKLGEVKDLVVDLERRAAVALLLSDGIAGGQARLIPFESIRTIGPDAVVVQDESCVVSPADRPGLRPLVESPVMVAGLELFTEEGRLLGTVSDLVVDDISGSIRQFEVSSGLLRDVLVGRKFLPVTAPRTMGGQLMVVPEGVMPASESQLEQGPPVALEAPPSYTPKAEPRQIEKTAAELVVQQADLVIGARAGKAVTDDDTGEPIVFNGETITQETVEKAKAAGKLNQLIEAAGEAAWLALARDLVEQYTRAALGRMAARTVHTPDGEIIVAQGDAITPEVVGRARAAGVLDQLAGAVRGSSGHSRRGGTSRADAAATLWEQISERVGWLTRRR